MCLLRMLFAIGIVAFPGTAMTQNVISGYDFHVTIPHATYQDFTGPFTIPVGFFGPGSDPFTAHVPLKGVPLNSSPSCPGGNLGATDTIIRRLNTAVLPVVPSTDVVPIEIVAMNLVSVNPITVTYSGGLNPEPWNLQVTVSGAQPSPGSMAITKQHPNGGVFSSTLRVYPVFVFTRQSDLTTLVIDGGLPPVLFNDWNMASVPWSYDSGPWQCEIPGCTTNFFPGITPSYTIQPYTQQGQYAVQALMPSCGSGPVPVEGRTWGAVKALYR